VVGILVTSAGRRGALIDLLRRALAEAGEEGRVLAADASPLSAAYHLADEGFLLPRHDDPGHVDALLDLCIRQGVRLVIPAHDGELPLLAAARERFAAEGVTLSVSGPATVTIARDKVRTHAFCLEHDLPTVRQAAREVVLAGSDAWRWPLISKPRCGSASVGVHRVESPDELARLPGDDLVVQEILPGVEHTIDVLVLAGGRVVCPVPRRRLEVRAGEVSKGVTVHDAALEALAARVAGSLPDPYGALNVQVFVDEDGRSRVVEINARYGGGFPLAFEAGAHYPTWQVQELCGRAPTIAGHWQEGLVMLRYDEAVFVTQSMNAPAS
jgi:carbamoyl-phosphate synthase large subunit